MKLIGKGAIQMQNDSGHIYSLFGERMTTERATKLLKALKILSFTDETNQTITGADEIDEALDMAIHALEQTQPQDGDKDCISRKGVLKLLYDHKTRTSGEIQAEVLQIELEVETIPSLPSVSQPKTGHWILVHPLQEDDGGSYMCDCCKWGHPKLDGTEKFCPNCGTKMIER